MRVRVRVHVWVAVLVAAACLAVAAGEAPPVNIGTTSGGSDVVKNGAVQEAYALLTHTAHVMWRDDAKKFYLSTAGEAAVTLAKPTVRVIPSGIATATLEGNMAGGGEVLHGHEEELAVRFSCAVKNRDVTVHISFKYGEQDGAVRFTFTKVCGYAVRRGLRISRGTNVSPGDVVEDGELTDEYKYGAPSASPLDKHTGFYFTNTLDTGVMQFAEPTITLESEDVMGVVLTGSAMEKRTLEPHETLHLNIGYHCLARASETYALVVSVDDAAPYVLHVHKACQGHEEAEEQKRAIPLDVMIMLIVPLALVALVAAGFVYNRWVNGRVGMNAIPLYPTFRRWRAARYSAADGL